MSGTGGLQRLLSFSLSTNRCFQSPNCTSVLRPQGVLRCPVCQTLRRPQLAQERTREGMKPAGSEGREERQGLPGQSPLEEAWAGV